MHRELNPNLFGSQNPVDKIASSADLSHSLGHGSGQPSAGILGRNLAAEAKGVPYPPNEFKGLEHQVATLKMELSRADRRAEAMATKLDELGKLVHGRLERFSQAIVRAEEIHSQAQQDTTSKLAQINGKVNERRVTDGKIQELIDRHNTIIRNFENRLHSLQRVVSEQEMALHNSQAALEEARAEISKLRR
jgi:chromosome segregation ATPase